MREINFNAISSDKISQPRSKLKYVVLDENYTPITPLFNGNQYLCLMMSLSRDVAVKSYLNTVDLPQLNVNILTTPHRIGLQLGTTESLASRAEFLEKLLNNIEIRASLAGSTVEVVNDKDLVITYSREWTESLTEFLMFLCFIEAAVNSNPSSKIESKEELNKFVDTYVYGFSECKPFYTVFMSEYRGDRSMYSSHIRVLELLSAKKEDGIVPRSDLVRRISLSNLFKIINGRHSFEYQSIRLNIDRISRAENAPEPKSKPSRGEVLKRAYPRVDTAPGINFFKYQGITVRNSLEDEKIPLLADSDVSVWSRAEQAITSIYNSRGISVYKLSHPGANMWYYTSSPESRAFIFCSVGEIMPYSPELISYCRSKTIGGRVVLPKSEGPKRSIPPYIGKWTSDLKKSTEKNEKTEQL